MASSKLVNSVRLIGTIIQPFERTQRGKFSVYVSRIEIQSDDTSVQTIPLTFYIRPQNQICDYKVDLTGKQVVVDGYIQGNAYTNKDDGKVIDYVYTVVRAISVLSEKETSRVAAKGSITPAADYEF